MLIIFIIHVLTWRDSKNLSSMYYMTDTNCKWSSLHWLQQFSSDIFSLLLINYCNQMIKHKSNILKEISIALRSSGAYLKEGIFLLTPPPQHIWTYCSCTCKTLVKRDFIVQILIYVLDNLVRSTCMFEMFVKEIGRAIFIL